MFDLLTYAAPFFVLLLIAEFVTYRLDDDRGLVGYDVKDSRTSLTMGLGNLIINVGWKIVVAAIYAAAYELTPLRIPSNAWWAWVLLFFADDFAYYWYHRLSHTVRLLWGSHVVHHSSQYYNFSTALRQPWVPMTAFAFWIPLALLGMPVWMILLQQAISLTYQFFIHTERVDRLPRPIEFVMNTPSHHRAHHGSNQIYLDKNYGGILIIWDRLFRTFELETERVRYGLTKNLETFNPLTVATHEYAAMVRDVRHADNWQDRFGYVFRGPGWAHDRRTATTAARVASTAMSLSAAIA